MLNIFNKLIDANEREITRLRKVVDSINLLENKTKKLSDSSLKSKTEEFKKKIARGESLDAILPEAFAVIREATVRVSKMRHFDVQLISATALHNGKISEQKTGEGKTLSATPAIYLNALSGKGVHVVTVNDYLARRDCGWMAPIFYFLGISTSVIIHEQAFIYDPKYSDKDATDKRLKHLKPVTRKEAYAADITYGTNNEFGFDYLRDNMARKLEDKVQRGHNYAIVDEVDSILIDEARTPLIISSPGNEPTEKYAQFSKIIKKLSSDSDYVIDEKLRTAHLTDYGIIKIEKMLGVDNLYEKDFSALHHIEEALKAESLFKKDRDYVVRDGEIIIVDEFTGRLMPGRRYSEGLHQAIEAKEGVEIQQESKTWATISFQNYFRMYEKLAGMTGTAATEAEEFHKIYKLDVVIIPTNKPMVRKDHPDSIFKTQAAKYTAVAEEIAKIHETGQPILVGTTSIEKNEYLSELLKRKKISHALLNAKNHEREAEIIADAGQKGAVTVATNLAGRGVDIQLGKGVDELGGLYVVGTERHESRRIDNQLRGRSGRQGDPGATKFFVSLEDDLMRIFGGEQIAGLMTMLKVPEDMPIEHGLVSKAIEGAQKKVEGHNFDIRKHTVEYDDVMNQQRKIIYGVRDEILEAAANPKTKGLKEDILVKIDAEILNIVTVNSDDQVNYEKIIDDFSTIIPFDDASKKGLLESVQALDSERVIEFLTNLAHELYEAREKQVGEEVARGMEVFVYFNTIDTLWVEHLDTMDDLRAGIGLRGYAQRDPLVEYKKEGFDLFERLIQTIDSEIVHQIYKISAQNQQPIQITPTIDLGKALEEHQEALDETQLLEEVGQLITETDRELDKTRHEDDYGGPARNASPARSAASAADWHSDAGGATKVIVERGGQVVKEEVYGETGNLQKKKVGRNDPCWCGSGKKYKKCHYPN